MTANCHAPRERVSWNGYDKEKISDATMSRSTWACELKCEKTGKLSDFKGHAPRERVSWNATILHTSTMKRVSRSTWACELKCTRSDKCSLTHKVTLHVSVWVEMWTQWTRSLAVPPSRSTWACELKCWFPAILYRSFRHAPRERVSWNRPERLRRGAPLVTLHVSVWVEIYKTLYKVTSSCVTLHVSVWVEIQKPRRKVVIICVTLHVSVWVEISFAALTSGGS